MASLRLSPKTPIYAQVNYACRHINILHIKKKILFWQAGRQNSVELVISGYLLMLMLMLMYISFAVFLLQ